MKTVQKEIGKADAKDLRWFGENVLGMSFPANMTETTMRSRIENAHTGPTITVPAEEEKPDAAVPVAKATKAKTAEATAAGKETEAEVDTDERAGVKAQIANATERLDTDSRNDPLIRIMLPSQKGPGGDRSHPVIVNGICMMIPRDKEVNIPYRYYLALKNAVETVYQQVKTSEGEDIVGRPVPAVPFTIIQAPGEAEVEAWYRRQGTTTPARAA